MMWVELDGKRIDVADLSEAKRIIRGQFPDAAFSEPIQVDHQRVIHVRSTSRRDPSPYEQMPVAVIVEQE